MRSQETHLMFSNTSEKTYVRHEATKSCEKRDNRDEMALVLVFKGLKVFDTRLIAKSCHEKDVATEAIQSSLLSAKDLGQEKVNSFIEKRMIVENKDNNKDKPEVPIHATLHKSKAKTFASLYEMAKILKSKKTEPS